MSNSNSAKTLMADRGDYHSITDHAPFVQSLVWLWIPKLVEHFFFSRLRLWALYWANSRIFIKLSRSSWWSHVIPDFNIALICNCVVSTDWLYMIRWVEFTTLIQGLEPTLAQLSSYWSNLWIQRLLIILSEETFWEMILSNMRLLLFCYCLAKIVKLVCQILRIRSDHLPIVIL